VDNYHPGDTVRAIGSQAKKLEAVYLELNRTNVVDDGIPDFLDGVRDTLRVLHLLGSSSLGEASLKSLAKCNLLEVLHMDEPMDVGFLEVAASLSRLKSLWLPTVWAETADDFVKTFSGMKLSNLLYLRLFSNDMDDRALLEICANCPELIHFDLSGSDVTDGGMREFLARASKLQGLVLYGCWELTFEAFRGLQLPQLRRLCSHQCMSKEELQEIATTMPQLAISTSVFGFHPEAELRELQVW
jgi:hypothetical protein